MDNYRQNHRQGISNGHDTEGAMELRFGILVLTFSALSAGSVLAAAPGDPVHGEQVFKKCLVCHTLEPGGKKIGPSLYGVVGRPAGTLPGFNYSDAMKNSGITWDDATLNTYLTDPKALVPKNKMAFPGLPAEQDRLDVIAYLKSIVK